MITYYKDRNKYFLNAKNAGMMPREDKSANQRVHIDDLLSGIQIRPDKTWTPFCEKLFLKLKANRICLDDISAAPNSDLGFINKLPTCTGFEIKRGKDIDLSPLTGNPFLEDVQLHRPGTYDPATYKQFDLSSLPNLRKCQVPVVPKLKSIFKCQKLISLCLCGGSHAGILRLDSLPYLEELICISVSKLQGVLLHSRVRLRSLELSRLKDIESIEPLEAFTDDLRVVELDRLPKMKIEWLRQAEKVECITLGGEIASINFLHGLKHLQVLDLFGSKVQDRDFSFRDSLKQELDPELWSRKA